MGALHQDGLADGTVGRNITLTLTILPIWEESDLFTSHNRDTHLSVTIQPTAYSSQWLNVLVLRHRRGSERHFINLTKGSYFAIYILCPFCFNTFHWYAVALYSEVSQSLQMDGKLCLKEAPFLITLSTDNPSIGPLLYTANRDFIVQQTPSTIESSFRHGARQQCRLKRAQPPHCRLAAHPTTTCTTNGLCWR
jgi:hypothetical protein